jgi:hypothetical protein
MTLRYIRSPRALNPLNRVPNRTSQAIYRRTFRLGRARNFKASRVMISAARLAYFAKSTGGTSPLFSNSARSSSPLSFAWERDGGFASFELMEHHPPLHI